MTLGLKGLPVINTQAYFFGQYVNDKEEKKVLITSTSGTNIIKLFKHFRNKLECLSLASLYNLV